MVRPTVFSSTTTLFLYSFFNLISWAIPDEKNRDRAIQGFASLPYLCAEKAHCAPASFSRSPYYLYRKKIFLTFEF